MASSNGHTGFLLHHVQTHPSSPLFARLAAAYIAADQPADALRVGEEGLKRHPSYSTGMLVTAKAMVMLRRYTDARALLGRLLAQLPGCRAARRLLDQLPTLELEYPPVPGVRSFSVNEGPGRGGGDDSHISKRDDLLPGVEVFARPTREKERSAAPVSPSPPTGAENVTTGEASGTDFDLQAVARRLEGARIPSLVPEDIEAKTVEELPSEAEVDLRKRPITETLLAIYIQQGKRQEAAEGYRRLAQRYPGRADEFLRKASELED